MPGSRKNRNGVLICGAYGHGNAGDEAILDAIVAELRSIDPAQPVTVLSRLPEETAARCNVQALHTFDLPAFFRVMGRAKLYINGGGSLIQDVTSSRSLFYYLFTIWLAKRRGCRVMMYGCGVGPVNHPWNRRLAGRIIDRYTDAITLREPNSEDELRSWGVTKPEMILASDPALSLTPAPDEEIDTFLRKQGLDPNGRYAAFCLRRWPGFWEKADSFAAAARHIWESQGLEPVFLSINQRNDGEAADCVLKLLEDIPCHAVHDPLPAGLAIGLLSRMELVVSMRLHGLIFAAGCGTPLVGISYDPKVTSFMEYIGQELCVPLEELTPELLCTLTDRAAALSGDRPRLLENACRLRQIETRNAETAAQLLEKNV